MPKAKSIKAILTAIYRGTIVKKNMWRRIRVLNTGGDDCRVFAFSIVLRNSDFALERCRAVRRDDSAAKGD